MTKPALTDLTPEQQIRLIEYARANGPCWKSKLCEAWAAGRDASMRDGGLLRQIRNQHGPRWLNRLPADLRRDGAQTTD